MLRCETVSLSSADGEVASQEMYHTVPVAEVDHTVHHCRCARDPSAAPTALTRDETGTMPYQSPRSPRGFDEAPSAYGLCALEARNESTEEESVVEPAGGRRGGLTVFELEFTDG